MEITAIFDAVINHGISVVIVLYFLWKDKTITKENTEILHQTKSLLDLLVAERKGD